MSWYSEAARNPRVGPIDVLGRNIVQAKGYSLLELERAGITKEAANQLGLPIDSGRKNLIGANVMQLELLLSASADNVDVSQ
jgi:ribosomal protein L13E